MTTVFLRLGAALIALGAAGTGLAQDATAPASSPLPAASAPAPASTATPAASAASAASTGAPDDPYLWLEPFDTPRVMDWVHAENAKTQAVLEKDPRFEALYRDALAVAQNHDRIPMPSQVGGKVYNFWQDAEHVRGLWRATTPADYDAGGNPHWHTVLDLDRLAADEHANWVWKGAVCEPRTQRRCLLVLSDGGEDATTVREFDLRTGRFVPGGFHLPHGKQRVAWLDADTLLVAREWHPGELTASSYPYIVKRVRRGEPLEKATEVVRGTKEDGGYGIDPHVLVDAQGRRAVLVERPVTTFELLHYLVTPRGPRELAMPRKADVQALFDGQLVIQLREPWTTGGATFPEGALVSVDLVAASRHPEALRATLVWAPGPRQSLENVAATRDALVVASLDNVRGRVARFTRGRDGRWKASPMAMPDNVSVDVEDADPRSPVAYLQVSGYLQPTSLWRATAEGAPRQVRATPALFDASRAEVQQFEATSTDGTRIPYFIVHPKGMAMDGSHPTILYGYGGFDVSLSPGYNALRGKLWIERGGVWVVANIRGGGEFGPAWHEAGLKTKRQIVYDDFAAVARDLVARGVTTSRRLGIMGGSNGGLLMGVEMTQHPELFHAVDIEVPLLDMERMEQIAAGTSWVGEYGSQSVPEERAFLAHISPYRQLKRDGHYPMPFVWTTTKDDRVGPQHARKFAARMAEYGLPYLFFEETEGGHGAGANLKERAHTTALEFMYFTRQLMD